MHPQRYWSADALPVGQTIDQLLYEIRCSDHGDNLMLDGVTLADIMEDSDGTVALDAMVAPFASLNRKMEALQRVMERTSGTVKPVAMQVTDPFTQRGVANVATIFELSDGQTVSIYFHNPDVTPKKMMGTDEVISWKWLLNKKDITIVVAPERGSDLNINEVARRIMKLAEKNSAAFQRVNAKKAESMQRLGNLKTEIAGLEKELKTVQDELGVAQMQAEERAASKDSREALLAAQKAAREAELATRVALYDIGNTNTKTGRWNKSGGQLIVSSAEGGLYKWVFEDVVQRTITNTVEAAFEWLGGVLMGMGEAELSREQVLSRLKFKDGTDLLGATPSVALPDARGANTLLNEYQALKSQNPEALLAHRVGDFYELFEQDAKTAASSLELTLTSRNGTPMAGFMFHALEQNLASLVKNGFSVAVSERDESGVSSIARIVKPESVSPSAAPVASDGGGSDNYAWAEKDIGYAPNRPKGKFYMLVSKSDSAIASAFGAAPKYSDMVQYFATPEDAGVWANANGYVFGPNPYVEVVPDILSEEELSAKALKVQDYVEKVIAGTTKLNKVDIGVICTSAADKIIAVTGLPAHSAMEVIIADRVIHATNRHPDLTNEDWGRLPKLTNQFDEVALGEKNINPDLTSIVVRKSFPDGEGFGAVLAFAQGKGKKRLNLVTYFKGRGKSLDAWWEKNKGLNPPTVPNHPEPASSAHEGLLKPLGETVPAPAEPVNPGAASTKESLIEAYKAAWQTEADKLNALVASVNWVGITDEASGKSEITRLYAELKNTKDIAAARQAFENAGYKNWNDLPNMDDVPGYRAHSDAMDAFRDLNQKISDAIKDATKKQGKADFANLPANAPIEDMAQVVYRKHGIETTGRNDYFEKIILAIKDKDAEVLQGVFGGVGSNNNLASMEVFERATGLKLANTQKARALQIDAWADITPEARAQIEADKDAAWQAKELMEAVKDKWNYLTSFTIYGNDHIVLNGQQWVLDLASEGKTEIKTFKKGAVPVYGLGLPGGSEINHAKSKTVTDFFRVAQKFGGLLPALALVGAVVPEPKAPVDNTIQMKDVYGVDLSVDKAQYARESVQPAWLIPVDVGGAPDGDYYAQELSVLRYGSSLIYRADGSVMLEKSKTGQGDLGGDADAFRTFLAKPKGMTEDQFKLAQYKQLRLDLDSGMQKPAQIIGGGHKNARKDAEKYLDDRIAEYEGKVADGVPIELTGKELGDFPDTEQGLVSLRAAAVAVYKKDLESIDGVTNVALNKLVAFDGTGRDKIESFSADPRKLHLVAKLGSIVRDGKPTPISPMQPHGKSALKGVKLVHVLKTPVKLAGESIKVRFLVYEKADGNLFYDHSVDNSEVKAAMGGNAEVLDSAEAADLNLPALLSNEPSFEHRCVESVGDDLENVNAYSDFDESEVGEVFMAEETTLDSATGSQMVFNLFIEGEAPEVVEFEDDAPVAPVAPVAEPVATTPTAPLDEIKWKRLKADIVGSISAIAAIDKGLSPGMDRSLFVSSIAGKIRRSNDRGETAMAGTALAFVERAQQSMPKPAFAPSNKIWTEVDWMPFAAQFEPVKAEPSSAPATPTPKTLSELLDAAGLQAVELKTDLKRDKRLMISRKSSPSGDGVILRVSGGQYVISQSSSDASLNAAVGGIVASIRELSMGEQLNAAEKTSSQTQYDAAPFRVIPASVANRQLSEFEGQDLAFAQGMLKSDKPFSGKLRMKRMGGERREMFEVSLIIRGQTPSKVTRLSESSTIEELAELIALDMDSLKLDFSTLSDDVETPAAPGAPVAPEPIPSATPNASTAISEAIDAAIDSIGNSVATGDGLTWAVSKASLQKMIAKTNADGDKPYQKERIIAIQHLKEIAASTKTPVIREDDGRDPQVEAVYEYNTNFTVLDAVRGVRLLCKKFKTPTKNMKDKMHSMAMDEAKGPANLIDTDGMLFDLAIFESEFKGGDGARPVSEQPVPPSVSNDLNLGEIGAKVNADKESDQMTADKALFQSVIDGSAPDLIEPDLADKLEAAYNRHIGNTDMEAMFEMAVNAYGEASLAASADL